jgi:TerC family integral membrane protein
MDRSCCVFSGLVAHWFGSEKALQFVTAYVMEKSLSVDNLFVFIMIFSYFKIEKLYQHKILFWGILGALVMRAVMIALGIQILEAFHFVIYIFGGFLIVTAIKMLFESKEEIEFERETHRPSAEKNHAYLKRDGWWEICHHAKCKTCSNTDARSTPHDRIY